MVDDSERKRNINALRFSWHESVIADVEVRKRGNALALAGYVMHRFNVNFGFAQISLNDVSRKLIMPRSTVIRSRDFLIKQGWLKIFERPKGPGGWHLTLKYTLGGGPDDLLIGEDEPSSVTDETT